MTAAQPDISVVIATCDRPRGLAAILASLRCQTLPSTSFEVVVVVDCPGERTPEVVERERARGELDLRVVRRQETGGPATARNDGWRAARAPLVAFTDDDCVAHPDWLAAGLRAFSATPGAIVQGRTEAKPGRRPLRPLVFCHWLEIDGLGPHFETCNMFYPREVLEQLNGFDAEAFPAPIPGGEDTDLAWRAIEAGAPAVFEENARVFHTVAWLGPIGKLRHAARWSQTIQIYARHPAMRESLVEGIFWKGTHRALLRLVVALALPRRLWPVRGWLCSAYLLSAHVRARQDGIGLFAAPFYVLHDLVELVAVVRGAIRYRTAVI